MSDAAGCFTLTWVIKNFSLFGTDEDVILISPSWDTVTNSKIETWQIRVLPGFRFDITHFLSSSCTLDQCEMYLVSSCGAVPLKSTATRVFSIKRNEILHEKRQSLLPDDTLTVCCRLWKKAMRTGKSDIGSVLRRVNYIWDIVYFDSVEFYNNSFIDNDNLILHMNLVKNCYKGRTHTVILGGVPIRDGFYTFVNWKLTILEGRGRVLCGESHASLYEGLKWDIEIFKEKGTSRNLRLKLECTVAVRKNLFPLSSISEDAKGTKASEAVVDTHGTLSNDLLKLFRERTLTDAVLNTDKKSFLAHRSILAARSRVFRDRFEGEHSTEGSPGVVDIKDVDSATLDRMLIYLYSDSLEEMKWDEARELYNAADKYAVHLLKQKCVEIMKDGLSMDNVCDALVFANDHSDEVLMKCAVDFIREHQEVISMPQWENLENSNLRLAAKITREILVKKEKN